MRAVEIRADWESVSLQERYGTPDIHPPDFVTSLRPSGYELRLK